jgi:hypothetical protein
MAKKQAAPKFTAEQFAADVEAKAAAPEPGLYGAPKFDGTKVKNALKGLNDLFQKLEPVILAATPDQYDALVQLAAKALDGLLGKDSDPAPAA